MESAIDKHLMCPRTLSRRVPDDYQPPFPMWVGRADEQLTQVVMAYLGVQYRGDGQRERALQAMREILGSFSLTDGPLTHDLTHHTDSSGYDNLMIVGYWKDAGAYCRWLRSPEVDGWWSSPQRLNDGLGYYREITAPRAEQVDARDDVADDDGEADDGGDLLQKLIDQSVDVVLSDLRMPGTDGIEALRQQFGAVW